jgi:N-acetylglucosamine kinase-like BadF-type ATPase
MERAKAVLYNKISGGRLTATEIAERVGLSLATTCRALGDSGVVLKRGRRPGAEPATEQKQGAARALRSVGKTYSEIGKSLGVTRQRAHQLVTGYNAAGFRRE